MSRRIIELEKPVLRRIGNLTIRVDRESIQVRGKNKKTWHSIDWARVLALIDSEDEPINVAIEAALGRRVHTRLTARRK